MNAKRSFYNAFWGLFSQIISIAVGIIIPRLVLVNLGSEANGLLSSVNQVLIYLNLLEAGIGTATLQALYAPVATQDRSKINRILSATNKYYKKVGSWYLAAVCVLSVVYAVSVKSSLSTITVMAVIFFSGLSQVINFFFQGKYRILMQAEGRNYVLINLGTFVTVCTSVLKVVLLLLGFNIAALQIMYFIFSVIQMIYICAYIKKNYQWIDLSVPPDEKALSQRNSVLIHQISGLIFSNTDVLLLTWFCNLKVVSVYSMYVMLFGMISTAISTLNGSVSFAMGQAYGTDREKFQKMYDAFETYNMALTFSLYCIANAFLLPFLKLYTAGVSDINYIDSLLPYLFIATYLLSNGRSAAQRVIEYSGHFKLTQNRSIIESAINLMVSLIAVNQFGIYGVLIGTIVALLYRTNDMILYAAHRVLKRSACRTYLKWGVNFITFIGITIILKRLLVHVDLGSYGTVIGCAVISSIIFIPVFFIVDSLIDKKSFVFCSDFVKSKLIRR